MMLMFTKYCILHQKLKKHIVKELLNLGDRHAVSF